MVDPALVAEPVNVRTAHGPARRAQREGARGAGVDGEGRSNAGITRRLWVTEVTVEKHVRSILAKLTLPETEDDHRRVLAVLAYLDSR